MGLGENQNLLNDGIYNASVKGIHPITGFEQACTLVEYGKKYHPVKKYAIDLGDMRSVERDKWLSLNRKWYLKMKVYSETSSRRRPLKGTAS